MQYVHTDNAPQAIGPYSQAVKVHSMVYTSGQIALTPAGEMLERNIVLQTKQVLKNLSEVLEAGESCMSNVVKTTIYLESMDDFATVNEIYEEAFGEHKPARSTVAVRTLPKNALVEIDAVAVVN